MQNTTEGKPQKIKITDEQIGKTVKNTVKVLLSLILLGIFYLGLENLGNRAKQVFYKDKYRGIEAFRNTCETANHVDGGCEELGKQMEKLEWYCSPNKSNKDKIECTLGGQDV